MSESSLLSFSSITEAVSQVPALTPVFPHVVCLPILPSPLILSGSDFSGVWVHSPGSYPASKPLINICIGAPVFSAVGTKLFCHKSQQLTTEIILALFCPCVLSTSHFTAPRSSPLVHDTCPLDTLPPPPLFWILLLPCSQASPLQPAFLCHLSPFLFLLGL